MNVFFKHKSYLLKHFFRFVLVFFALMPCAVKNILFMETHVKPVSALNISKVPGAGAESCSVYTPEKMQAMPVETTRSAGTGPERVLPYVPENVFPAGSYEGFCHTANAPPLYLLYKRLRIAVAA